MLEEDKAKNGATPHPITTTGLFQPVKTRRKVPEVRVQV